MSLRRRIALFLDPDIAPEPATLMRLDFSRHREAVQLERIATAIERIDRKTKERRPRIIECAHPELHPADEPFDEMAS